MLSRHAEDLYWIGRYLERAEDTARLLSVTQESGLETGTGRPTEEMWAELMEVLFLDDVFEDTPTAEACHRFLVSDPDNSGSIVSILTRARENTRAAREWVSAEFWEGINDLHLQMRGADLEDELEGTPYDLMRRVKTGCQALAGIADSSLPRTEGYRFYRLGKMLERGLLTIRVVSVWQRRLGGFSASAAYPEWVKLLKSLSGYEAYLRAHRASMQPAQILEFLLQGQHFPRSLFYCLTRAEQQIRVLGSDEIGRRCARAVSRLRADLEFAEPADLAPDALDAYLQRIQDAFLELPGLIENDYFRPGSAQAALHAYEAF